MDLLTRPSSLVVVALAVAAAMTSTGCARGGDGTSVPEQADPTAPSQTLVSLEPVRPDEVLTGRSTGTGSLVDVLDGVADDVVLVYGVCGSIVTSDVVELTLSLPSPEVLTVPCDGVPTRAQVFTMRGDRFGVDVDADAATSWSLLVTGRRERTRR